MLIWFRNGCEKIVFETFVEVHVCSRAWLTTSWGIRLTRVVIVVVWCSSSSRQILSNIGESCCVCVQASAIIQLLAYSPARFSIPLVMDSPGTECRNVSRQSRINVMYLCKRHDVQDDSPNQSCISRSWLKGSTAGLCSAAGNIARVSS